MAGKQVVFVTGASSGFGLEICLAALNAGLQVIGSVRSRAKSADAFKKLESAGAKIVELDLSQDAATIQAIAKEAEKVFGKVDILINNGAYSLLGAIEDFNEQEAHLQFNTNFFGPLFLIQALLPGMRARRHGTIANISSTAGLDGLPSCGLYAGTKFALEGMSESLAKEVSSWGIRVLIVEPGVFRTNFFAAYVQSNKGLSEPYKGGVVDETLQKFDTLNGRQPGDPVKGAKAIVDVVASSGADGCTVDERKVLRLPLGRDAIARMDSKIESLSQDKEACRMVAESTDIVQ